MATLRLFLVSSLFTYRALFHWLNPAAYVLQKTLFPLIQMTFFAIVGTFAAARPLDFYLVGNAILVAYRPMFTIATAVADERRGGTLPYIVASPADRVALFFGRSTFHIFDGLLDVVLAFGYAVVAFGLDLSRANWIGLALAIVAATYGASAIGLLLGSAAYLVLDAAFLANAAMFSLLLLTGANVPLEDLPSWLHPLSAALPVTRSVEAGRLYTAGAELGAGIGLVASDVLVGTIWAGSALLLFRWIESQARRHGTLEGM